MGCCWLLLYLERTMYNKTNKQINKYIYMFIQHICCYNFFFVVQSNFMPDVCSAGVRSRKPRNFSGWCSPLSGSRYFDSHCNNVFIKNTRRRISDSWVTKERIPYLLERAPRRFLNFSTCRCGANSEGGGRLFKTAYYHSLFLFCL